MDVFILLSIAFIFVSKKERVLFSWSSIVNYYFYACCLHNQGTVKHERHWKKLQEFCVCIDISIRV